MPDETNMKTTFVDKEKKPKKASEKEETKKTEEQPPSQQKEVPKENTYFNTMMTEVVPKIPREYAHTVFGAGLPDGGILLVPIDSLNTSRVSIVLDAVAVKQLELILDERRKLAKA